ncbi:MAG: DUF2207 domain-containing protein [Betaproteobacteria bacterium]
MSVREEGGTSDGGGGDRQRWESRAHHGHCRERRRQSVLLDDWPADERVPGTYRVEETSDGVEVAWHFRAEDESRTFALAYRIKGAVVSHNDVTELYWKCVGDEWVVGASEAKVTIALPKGASKEDIRAWAHGPLWG